MSSKSKFAGGRKASAGSTKTLLSDKSSGKTGKKASAFGRNRETEEERLEREGTLSNLCAFRNVLIITIVLHCRYKMNNCVWTYF